VSHRAFLKVCLLLLVICLAPKASAEVAELTYQSAIDGASQKAWFAPPTPGDTEPPTLIVYSHGMTGGYMEPFVIGKKMPLASLVASAHPKYGFLSLGRENSWMCDGVLQDMTNMINRVTKDYPVDRIILMGTSMGGSTMLTYAEKAPENIKSKIIGVLAIYPAGDLYRLYELTTNKLIEKSVKKALESGPGTPRELNAQRSFIPNIQLMPKTTKVAVISAEEDVFVPTKLQKDIVKACKSNQIPVKFIPVPGDHGTLPPPNRVLVGLDFVNYKNIK
jgi:hypothetical protein